MNFKNSKPIFIQIADQVCNRVLSGEYIADERIPSIRDLAIELEVNLNTINRSYERLQQEGIIYNKRGIGYFISPEALRKIKSIKHSQFLEEVLPSVFKEMILLDLGMDDLVKAFDQYCQENK
ncbi:MAG: GntR family transcriptional regulator [Tannerellaceae bacterium]|jgi:DNA-binding transcriptional regulator YhcF (GntR family)|nr:GntR family transcriptional regulator [Tannerellaceae bacterium]